jgi:hypothetical protein
MAQGQTHSLRDEEIVAYLISDNLSDVPQDISSESDGASGYIFATSFENQPTKSQITD